MALSAEEELFQKQQAAQARFRAQRKNFVLNNPNAVSHFEAKRTLAQEDLRGLREHEMAMLNANNEREIAVAHEKRLGMAEQGKDAAQINADALRDVENTKLTAAEKELATKKDIALGEQETQRKIAEAHEAGETTRVGMQQDGANRVATTQGRYGVEAAKINAEAQIKSADANARAAAMNTQLKNEIALTQDQTRRINNLINAGLTYQDAYEQVMGKPLVKQLADYKKL